MKKWIIGIIAIVVLYLIAAVSFNFFPFAQSADSKVIKVGIMAGDKNEDKKWALVTKNAKKLGYKIELTHFTDYSQPNTALANKEIDANAFQHYAFLKDWNSKNKGTIVSVGDTTLGPSRLYSNQYKNISEIPDGSKIAIANDATNGARALLLLNAAGLIKTKDGNVNPTVQDIVSNPKNLKIVEVSADQTLASLKDVAAAVISQNYIESAGLDINSAIYVWGGTASNLTHQWINIIAARKDNAKTDKIKALVKAYHQKNVANLINSIYNGAEVPAWSGAPQASSSSN